jgi:2-methylcitrate dehydratase PrpD
MREVPGGLAATIAEFVASAPVSEEQLDQARLAILDTVGVALAGGGERTPAVLRSQLRPGRDTDPALWWDRTPVPLTEAVLMNAVAAHALDYDCLIPAAYVQPGAVLIPGLIALAERDSLTGARLLDGAARGIGLLGALGRALGNQLHTAGWHPTSVLGVVAGAAAAAHLAGQPPERVATAVNIAVSLSGGLKQNFGSMTKELQVGEAARGAVEAAMLSAAGITADARAADAWLGLMTASAPAAAALELQPARQGVHVKRYSCCGRMHAALDAAAMLRSRHAPAAGEVRAVTCHLNPVDIAHIDRDAVRSPAEAKFSVQYGLARMLVRGQAGLSDFEPPELAAADVASVMARVRIQADDSVPSFGAEVVVELPAGRQQRRRADAPVAATAQDVAGKFTDCCVSGGRDAAQAAEFAALTAKIGDLPDVRALVRSLPALLPAPTDQPKLKGESE